MKIYSTIYTSMALAIAMLFTGCTNEDEPIVAEYPGVTFEIFDAGFGSTSRASESGYATEFTAGDACGLYIVRNGNVVCSNVKLSATENGGSLTWQAETSIGGGLPGERYYLYYPYQTEMDGNVDASATDAEGFFAPLISGWEVKADQSDYADYTASDLMTAKGNATPTADGKINLSFSMTHRMALAVIEMPMTVYKFTNTAIPITDYAVAASADFSTGEMQPYKIASGTYRCIIKHDSAGKSINGVYADGDKFFEISTSDVASGKFKVFKVEGAVAIEKQHRLQEGDFLLADGSLVGKNEILTDAQRAQCVAVVFFAGHYPYDTSDYSDTGIKSEKCHGYAVALHDATTEKCIWGVSGQDLGCYPKKDDGTPADNYLNNYLDGSAYTYTKAIIEAAGSENKLNAIEPTGYPATYYAVVAYEQKVKAPDCSSGWFLPSSQQLLAVLRSGDSLFNDKKMVDELTQNSYWCSSEFSRDPAPYALCLRAKDDYVGSDKKNLARSHVRSVLAF